MCSSIIAYDKTREDYQKAQKKFVDASIIRLGKHKI